MGFNFTLTLDVFRDDNPISALIFRSKVYTRIVKKGDRPFSLLN